MFGGFYLGNQYFGGYIYGAKLQLFLSDASHQLSSDNVTLTQKHTLVVGSSGHSLASPGILLAQKHQLAVSNTLHGLTNESVILTQKHLLTVANALNSLASTNVALTQKHTIVVNNTTHGLTSEVVVLVEHKTIVVQSTMHGHTVDGNLPIVVQFYLDVQGALHNHSAQSVTLTQRQLLTIASTLHSLISQNLNGLIDIEPPGFGGGWGAPLMQWGGINFNQQLHWWIIDLDSYIRVRDNLYDLPQKIIINGVRGSYTNRHPDDGSVGDEYEIGGGLVPQNPSKKGQFNSNFLENNGLLSGKWHNNGTYDLQDKIIGQLTNKYNKKDGFLPSHIIEQGSFSKTNTPQGEYEVE